MLDMQEQLSRELRFSISPAEQKQIKQLLQSSTKLHDNKFEGLDLQITREVDVNSQRRVSDVGLNGFTPRFSNRNSFSISSESSPGQVIATVVPLAPLRLKSKLNKEVK